MTTIGQKNWAAICAANPGSPSMVSAWGTPVEVETRKRILVAAAAYAYEIEANPIMDDGAYDALAASIDLTINTTRPDMDTWFRMNFQPHTGQWVHAHPDKEGLKRFAAGVRASQVARAS